MGYVTGLLQLSNDPLSDTTPTYVDVTSYLAGDVDWSDGKSRNLDDPQAGQITFRLRNANGEWNPNSASSLFPNSPFILRRVTWSVNGTQEGVWYVTRWQPVYPAQSSEAFIDVTAVDGFELLSLDLLDLLDPPTATTYEEVVMHDAPFAYYKLDEKFGTLVSAVTGAEGAYKNTPTLAQPGLLAGDPGTSVMFDGDEYTLTVMQETTAFIDRDAATLEAWVQPAEAVGSGRLRVGGGPAVSGNTSFYLRGDGAGGLFPGYGFFFASGGSAVGTTLPVNGETRHVVGTYDTGILKIYVDGVLEDTADAALAFPPLSADPKLSIGNLNDPSLLLVRLQHVAFYEHALTPERVLAHYQAGAQRGFNAQTAGARISAVATSALWAETGIQTGEHTVAAVMEHGQSKLEEIIAALKSEMPDSLFFFDGDGNPTYLAWNYKDGLGPLATFGTGAGEHSYQALEPVYDDEIFNEVNVGHEASPGAETQHTAIDQASIDAYYRRAHSESLILTEHDDALAVCHAILERHHEPMQRFASLTLNGWESGPLAQILNRQIGDMIRVKGPGVNDSDIVATILGRTLTFVQAGGTTSAIGHLTCTWTLGRGFNAAAGTWRLGIAGFTELNSTAILA